MALPSQIHFHQKGDESEDPSKSGLLVFFIPGNPGCIEYYRTTLQHIYGTLQGQTDSVKVGIMVFGSSLVGFDSHAEDGTPYIHADQQLTPPLNLESQTQFILKTLLAVLASLKTKQHVVLVGHSIGAYMVLKLIESAPKAGVTNVAAGMCLCPTVVEIARSPSGRMATPLLRFSLLPALIHYISRPLQLVPLPELIGLVRYITGMPVAPAITTAKFLHSPHGVHQALYLAADEMRSVTDDRWDDQFWGVAEREEVAATGATIGSDACGGKEGSRADARARLFFYWGSDDHWVANTTRDALIAKRGRGVTAAKDEEDKPVMEIDGHGIPHAFPLKPEHSRIVAEKVAEWTIEILKPHR